MKKLTNFLLPIDIGIDLGLVSSIKFKFQQGQRTLMFSYPSGKAVRQDGKNIVLLRWSAADTMIFECGMRIDMDTHIRLADSEDNPWTEITSVIMDRTLFLPEEVGV